MTKIVSGEFNMVCGHLETDLKPCPFCGSESEMKRERHCGSGAEFEYTPRCTATSCAGRLAKKWLSCGEAVAAWNKRK